MLIVYVLKGLPLELPAGSPLPLSDRRFQTALTPKEFSPLTLTVAPGLLKGIVTDPFDPPQEFPPSKGSPLPLRGFDQEAKVGQPPRTT